MLARFRRAHFIGLGGIGMSGVAEVLIAWGFEVSGSDVAASPVLERLASRGARVHVGHDAAHVAEADVVVRSSAIRPDNPELREAERRGLPVVRRAEMLAEMMRDRRGVAVTGMHGKTTTTTMVTAVLAAGGLDPTAVVGGRVEAWGSSVRVGNSDLFVAEADESDRSFLDLWPVYAVVTNVDREHMDCYADMDDVLGAFRAFMDEVPFHGAVIVGTDDPVLRALARSGRPRVITCGESPDSDLRVGAVTPGLDDGRPVTRFAAHLGDQDLGEFAIHVPGRHNVWNASAAIALGLELGVAPDAVREGLAAFRRVDRRFQLRGEARGVAVVDDYGHHPTELRATLAAARSCGYRRVHIIFQPHRYTRTHLLFDDFATAFDAADSLQVLDIYAASEDPIPSVTGQTLARRIRELGRVRAHYARSLGEAIDRVAHEARSGDVILTCGAGDVSKAVPLILDALGGPDAAAPRR